jgi:predicted negative regulator of RcsB-dependent stress response
MNRWHRVALAAVLALAMVGLTRAEDVVHLKKDRPSKKKDVKDPKEQEPDEYRGKIEEESPAGIKIKLKRSKDKDLKFIPAGDIDQVAYDCGDVASSVFRGWDGKKNAAAKEPVKKKRTEKFDAALKGFIELEPKLRGEPFAARYVKFRIAEIIKLKSQDDPAQVDEAIKTLMAFKKDHSSGWETLAALKMLAKLQEDSGKIDDARKTYEELAELPGVSKEMKQESEVLVGKLLLRADKWTDAETRLEKLSKDLSDADAVRPFVLAYLAEARIGQNKLDGLEKQLKDLIAANNDSRLRGVLYNRLGDYYRKKAKPADAFWSYLRVDAMYNEDPEEQAKALYYLSSLFDKEKKDPIRGKECIERLKSKRFDGTVYQKMVEK